MLHSTTSNSHSERIPMTLNLFYICCFLGLSVTVSLGGGGIKAV